MITIIFGRAAQFILTLAMMRVATGSILKIALDCLPEDHKLGIYPSIYSCLLLNPIKSNYFKCLYRFKKIVSIEEHIYIGGLGSIFWQHMPGSCKLKCLNISDDMAWHVWSQDYLRDISGLTKDNCIKHLVSGSDTN